MKNKLIFTSFLIGAALVTSCKPSPEKATAQQLDKAQATTKEAAQEIKAYAFAQKTEFVAHMKASLAELNRSLDELSGKIEKSSDQVKAEAKPKLAALREQAKKWEKQIEASEGATATTWDTVKAEAQKACDAVKEGFAQARQWASDKIAP